MALIENTINSILNRITLCLKKFLNISVSFSIGDMCRNLTSVSQSYEAAEKLLKERFYAGKSCIIRNFNQDERTNSFLGLSIEKEKQIISYIKDTNITGLISELQGIFKQIKDKKLSTTSSQMILTTCWE
jgi:hypothetical protein